jgi:hypothetical protein
MGCGRTAASHLLNKMRAIRPPCRPVGWCTCGSHPAGGYSRNLTTGVQIKRLLHRNFKNKFTNLIKNQAKEKYRSRFNINLQAYGT